MIIRAVSFRPQAWLAVLMINALKEYEMRFNAKTSLTFLLLVPVILITILFAIDKFRDFSGRYVTADHVEINITHEGPTYFMYRDSDGKTLAFTFENTGPNFHVRDIKFLLPQMRTEFYGDTWARIREGSALEWKAVVDRDRKMITFYNRGRVVYVAYRLE